MKTMGIVGYIIMMFTAAISCQTYNSSGNCQSYHPKEFQLRLQESRGLLIDVRTPEEFASERILDAININVNDPDFETKAAGLNKRRPVFVYCGVGKRSALAQTTLMEMGFKKVCNLEGGLEEWKNAGLPVITGGDR